jgi:hypothetical protein
MASERGGENRTAGRWADENELVFAINAGMYLTDHKTNVGYARAGKHENNPRWNQYQSVLAWRDGEAVLADRGDIDPQRFSAVVQNLRLIKGSGESVWKQNGKKWSEALAAVDDKGRLLFIFSRTPFQMSDLNQQLLALPLGIQRAMHLEGGPEASLSLRSRGLALDLAGSFETGFNENDDNGFQWAIPNVIGVRRSSAGSPATAPRGSSGRAGER